VGAGIGREGLVVNERSAAAIDTPSQQAQAVLARLAAKPYGVDLFQAMRRIEGAHPDKPRLGDALRPGDEPIRFSQEASLAFAPSAISGIELRPGKPPRFVQRVFGYLGPNGALPIHLTEYTRERQHYHGDPTIGSFLDMLLHRFGLFFYRAWARSQPVVELDRPDSASIVKQVGSLFGSSESAGHARDALGDFPKLFFAGRLARQVRDADGLEAWIRLHFGVPVKVHQFCGHWMALDASERSRLRRDGQAGLGRGAMLGSAVWDVQHKFRVEIGPLGWRRFASFLPGAEPLAQLQAMVRQYVGFEFNWDLRLLLRREEVPAWRLGGERGVGQLGRTGWLHAAERGDG